MSKTLTPSVKKVSFDDDKARKYREKVRAVYEKAGLTEEEAQRVNEAPGLNDLIARFIAEHRHTNKYKDEEVASNYGYLSGYKPGVQDIDRQIEILKQTFKGLGDANPEYLAKVMSGLVVLPPGSEKFAAIPNWKKRSDIFGVDYNAAFEVVLTEIEKSRCGRFHNYRKGQLGPKNLRQTSRSVAFWDRLIEEQGNPDILIVPVQLGLVHRGRSVRRAREVFRENEFGLGAFAVGITLLTHIERLNHLDDLWIDCAGDEFDDPGSDVRFDDAPYFFFNDDRLRFGAGWYNKAYVHYGAASGFSSQQQ